MDNAVEGVSQFPQPNASVNGNVKNGRTRLKMAVLAGNKVEVEQLLANSEEECIEAQDLNGFTALSLACYKGHADIVELLLDSNAEIETRNKEGFTPLLVAVQENRENIVKLLLKKDANIDARNSEGLTPLNIASKNGYQGIVQLLLRVDKCADTMEIKDVTGDTPLSWASDSGHTAIVELLLESGASTKTKHKRNFSPLHIAVQKGHYEIVKLLLTKEADIEDRDINGCTPLSIASRYGHQGIAQLLLENGAKVETRGLNNHTPLSIASYNGHRDIAQLLLDKRAKVETRDLYGNTPLILGCERGHARIVELLLKRDAQVDTKNDMGFFPLYLAALNGHQNIAELLINHNSDVNMTGLDGLAPLSIASMWGFTGMAQLLLDKGADTETKNIQGFVPLYHAAQAGHQEVVQLLLQKGADIGGGSGIHSPLHVSSQRGYEEVVTILLKHEVKNEKKDGAGHNTSLELAAMYGQTGVVHLLIEHETNYGSKNVKGLLESALDISVIHGQVDTVKYFIDRLKDTEEKRVAAEHVLSLAAEHGQKEVISMLVKLVQNLNLDEVDESGLSPLAKALTNSNFGCVRLLHSLIGVDSFYKGILTTNHEKRAGGSIDIYEYLLLAGLDTRQVDSKDRRICDYLCFSNEIDWDVFDKTLSPREATGTNISKVSSFVEIKGVGSIRNLYEETKKSLTEVVNEKVKRMITHHTAFIGSSAELTKVGLLDEVDVMVLCEDWKNTRGELKDVGHGYVRIDSMPIKSSSKEFHDYIWESMESIEDNDIISFPKAVVRGGAASTPMKIRWCDSSSPCRPCSLTVSVDIVPLLPVWNDWPDDAVQETWLMNREELKSRGYQLVARPPHQDSSFGKDVPPGEREKLYRMTFSKLEVEHLQNLKTEVKEAYILAKCLRNPVACRIVVKDEDGVIHFVDKFITSYLLKTVFLHNVGDFLQNPRPLIEMTYIIYCQLEYYLSYGFIPVFWMPNINTLEGANLNAAKSHRVAAYIKSFLQKAYRHELKKEPPEDVNGARKITIPYDKKKIDLSDASKIQILSVPLKEEDTIPLSTCLQSAYQTANDDVSSGSLRLVTEATSQIAFPKTNGDEREEDTKTPNTTPLKQPERSVLQRCCTILSLTTKMSFSYFFFLSYSSQWPLFFFS